MTEIRTDLDKFHNIWAYCHWYHFQRCFPRHFRHCWLMSCTPFDHENCRFHHWRRLVQDRPKYELTLHHIGNSSPSKWLLSKYQECSNDRCKDTYITIKCYSWANKTLTGLVKLNVILQGVIGITWFEIFRRAWFALVPCFASFVQGINRSTMASNDSTSFFISQSTPTAIIEQFICHYFRILAFYWFKFNLSTKIDNNWIGW